MPKAVYPKELKDPVVFNKRRDEYIKRRNSQIGEMKPWRIDEDATWRYSNRVATEDLIRHYADAYGDTNPLWRNVNYARNTRYGGIIAPPTFLTCIIPTVIADEQDELPLGVFNGGADYEWFKVIHAGDEIHGYDTFLGFVEKIRKDKAAPAMLIGTTRRTYINQRDEMVANVDAHIISLGVLQQSAARIASFPKMERWKYTEEDLEEINRTYAEMEKTRRGADIRWWEDVVAGEELRPVVQGPYDLMDVVSMMGVQAYMSTAFGIKWKRQWNHTRYALDEYGVSTFEPHLRDHEGLGYIYAQSVQSEAGICHLICNWMGDDGFLKKMSAECRRPMPLGDTNWIKGKIVRKYVQNGEYLVDIEVRCTTQRGVMHMPATTTVRLLSREMWKHQAVAGGARVTE